MTMAEEIVYTRLLCETAGVSARQFQKLLLLFGSPSEIFDVSEAELAENPHIGSKLAKAIGKARRNYASMQTDTNSLAAKKIFTRSFLDENYPSLLRALGDPPPLLFYRGDFSSNNGKSVAVVGPVAANQESVGQAVRLGRGLAERGISVITGLGKGVEASAQVGAVVTGNPSCLILSCGYEADLTEEEITLGVQVEKKGALISEYSPLTKKSPEREAAGRRLVVALAQAVLVIGTTGGDGLTEAAVELAVQQGRPIFVFNSGDDANFPAEAIPLTREEEIDLVVRSLV